MIISHKYKFIFIKTARTAGTSIELYLSQYCGKNDVITAGHLKDTARSHFTGQNYLGYFNPLPEVIMNKGFYLDRTLKNFLTKQRYAEHMPAAIIQARTSASTWSSYFKFCVERNPWDKTLSHFHASNALRTVPISLDDYLADKNKLCINHPLYTDRKGNIIVDQVVPFENLNDALGDIFHSLSIPYEGSINISANSQTRKGNTHYRNAFDLKQKRIIEQVFSKEIELHRYTW